MAATIRPDTVPARSEPRICSAGMLASAADAVPASSITSSSARVAFNEIAVVT